MISIVISHATLFHFQFGGLPPRLTIVCPLSVTRFILLFSKPSHLAGPQGPGMETSWGKDRPRGRRSDDAKHYTQIAYAKQLGHSHNCVLGWRKALTWSLEAWTTVTPLVPTSHLPASG